MCFADGDVDIPIKISGGGSSSKNIPLTGDSAPLLLWSGLPAAGGMLFILTISGFGKKSGK